MTKYTKTAVSAALLLPFLSVASAWTSASTSRIGNPAELSSRKILHQLNARPSSFSSTFSSADGTDALLNKISSSTPAAQETVTNADLSSSSQPSSIIDLVNSIESFFTSLTAPLQDLSANNNDKESLLKSISKDQLSSIVQQSVDITIQSTKQIDDLLLSNPTIGPILSLIQNKIISLLPSDIGNLILNMNLPPSIGILASAVTTYTIVSTVLSLAAGDEIDSSVGAGAKMAPYPLGRYDARGSRVYFDKRLNEVIGRSLEIGSQSLVFGLSLLSDKLNNKLDDNADQRGIELAELLTRLGPTFIKIGQSLSIRTDLLSPAYVRGLKSLQDQVPPFETSVAKEIIEEELGLNSIDDVFVEFSAEPVAAASLGQVYKAKLRADGREVAIKVQRPNIMNQIALDMHLLRELAPWAKRTFNLNTDLSGTVDAWGAGFVDELDYISEAENAENFLESIESTPLGSVVFSPGVVEECTTGKVLTTEWVIGERLDKSSNEDVTVLCSIAMNTYLTMMLETGVLHCDPHPGNLLRTPDGKLCILDWGMVTRLEPDLQITLIEHMAHLTSADYDEIPRDLLLLGFIPEEKADLIGDSGIVEVLADIYGSWTKGGGAASVNVNQVVAQLQDLTEKNGNFFQIPPYFAYIAKSFSVLEGIGLSNDPKYSIINECLPYVSKRLLTDKSERTGGALSTFIFGPQKNDESRIIDYDRVEQLISGFGDYTTSASGASIGKEKTRTELIDDLVDQVLDLVATEEETPLQTIFIEQLAKIISSSSRSIFTELRERSGKLPTGRTVLGTIVDPLGLFRTSPIVRMNAIDEQTVETTRNLIRLLNEQSEASGNNDDSNNPLSTTDFSNAEIQELSSKLVRKVWQKRTRIAKTSNRLATKLLQLTADKLESGQRDVLVLPTTVEGVSNEDERNDGRIHENQQQMKKSDRLLNAKRILEEAEVEAAASGSK